MLRHFKCFFIINVLAHCAVQIVSVNQETSIPLFRGQNKHSAFYVSSWITLTLCLSANNIDQLSRLPLEYLIIHKGHSGFSQAEGKRDEVSWIPLHVQSVCWIHCQNLWGFFFINDLCSYLIKKTFVFYSH